MCLMEIDRVVNVASTTEEALTALMLSIEYKGRPPHSPSCKKGYGEVVAFFNGYGGITPMVRRMLAYTRRSPVAMTRAVFGSLAAS